MQKIHMKSPKNWINDPNGFIWYKEMYHLFYQHFPYAPKWGRMHWGHCVSKDLVHWEHKDIALYPSKVGDRSGCFSGSGIEQDGKLYLFYTGVNYTREDEENINCTINDSFIASQMRMVSVDGENFDNLQDKITVIPPITDEEIGSKVHTRDPKVWRGKDGWYMILGSTKNNLGRFLVYRSEDLEHWEYINASEKEHWGWMWECPDYFEIAGKGVVVFSPIGIMDQGSFYDSATVWTTAFFDEKEGTLQLGEKYEFIDYGIDLYAPQTTLDEMGRRVMIAWARMPMPVEGKWSGMMSIPRVVEYQKDHLYFRPHPNIKQVFCKEVKSTNGKAKDWQGNQPANVDFSKGCLVKATLKNGEKISIGGFEISRSLDEIHTNRSQVMGACEAFDACAHTPKVKEGDELVIFVDSNLIEVFVNDGEYVLSQVVYDLTDEIIGKGFQVFEPVENM